MVHCVVFVFGVFCFVESVGEPKAIRVITPNHSIGTDGHLETVAE